jgi:putative glutamine amidotransferase
VKLAPHPVQISGESRLGRLLGPAVSPPGGHHQGLNRVGSGLLEVGWAAQDQLVEAVELTGHRFAIGVQWQPQEGEDNSLFAALIEAASEGQTVAVKPVLLKPDKRR